MLDNPEWDESQELPQWFIPPLHGFRSADLDRMPNLPSHAQLIDGSLVIRTPQSSFHSCMITLLDDALLRAVPRHLEVIREMTVTLTDQQRPEPDLMVVRRAEVDDLDQVTFDPADVFLVVEVVDGDSAIRDRVRKPQLYAEAGIPHLWRIEYDWPDDDGRGNFTAYTYELDPAIRSYASTGIHHNRLKTSIPIDIDVDLTEIRKM